MFIQVSDILVLFIYMDFLEDYYDRLDSQSLAVKIFSIAISKICVI